MSKCVSIVGYPIKGSDVKNAMRGASDSLMIKRFMVEIGRLTQSRPVFTANSGNACFYVILKTLQKIHPEKTEVILPAYTAPSLIVPIQKAGLKPVLCDIALDDFNMDFNGMLGAVTGQTLAVLGVHMFGIPWSRVVDVKRSLPAGTALIEDVAQAMGAKLNGVSVGFFGDASFFSFNRGKNLPILTGGIAATPDAALAEHLRAVAQALLTPKAFLKNFSECLKCSALRIAFDPAWYGALRFLIARFKDIAVPGDIATEEFSRFQAAFGLSLLDRFDEAAAARHRNGMFLLKAFAGLEAVLFPELSEGVAPVFNRLPVIFKNSTHVPLVLRRLEEVGIESSRLYSRPIHHIFDLGYERSAFPNAVYLAERLLTLPVHPLVTQEDLGKIVDVVRGVAGGQ